MPQAPDATVHDAALDQAIHAQRAVVFVSNLTDARPVTARLHTAGIPHHVERMGMGDAAMRERFHQLQRRTGWSTLPQVFIDGEFVGGIDEALAHPALSAGAGPQVAANWARALGYGGLIPFAALAAVVIAAPDQAPGAGRLLAGYGATILAFLGALHWGWILAGRDSRLSVPAALSWGVMPALIGWLSLALAPSTALGLQAAAFAAAWGVDRRAWGAYPAMAWFLRLRTHLSAVVVLLLATAAAASI
jgi:glutaredoxin-related protein